MEQTAHLPITIYAAACVILGREAKTGADFEEAGVPMLGGCEICGASIAAYNACPSKTGHLRCLSGCIGDLGFASTLDWMRHMIADNEDSVRQAVLRSQQNFGGDECQYQESGQERKDANKMRRALMCNHVALRLALQRCEDLLALIAQMVGPELVKLIAADFTGDPKDPRGLASLDELRLRSFLPQRRVICHCCAETFSSKKPRDPDRDFGYGTCASCAPRVKASWVKDNDMTEEQAQARLDKYA